MLRLSVAKYAVHVMRYAVIKVLCLYISTFRIICAVPSMAGCCASLHLCFEGVLLRCFLNEYETVAVAPITTAITFIFMFHVCCVSILRYYLYFCYYFCKF